jgi:hypothetical protein
VREEHSATAIALQSQMVQGLALAVVVLDHLQKELPHVPHHLSAGEAADRNDHSESPAQGLPPRSALATSRYGGRLQ